MECALATIVPRWRKAQVEVSLLCRRVQRATAQQADTITRLIQVKSSQEDLKGFAKLVEEGGYFVLVLEMFSADV